MDDDDDDDAAGWEYALGRDGGEEMLDGTPNNVDASAASASQAMAVQRRRGDEIMLLSEALK